MALPASHFQLSSSAGDTKTAADSAGDTKIAADLITPPTFDNSTESLESRFFDAIVNDDPKAVQECIDQGVNIFYCASWKKSSLTDPITKTPIWAALNPYLSAYLKSLEVIIKAFAKYRLTPDTAVKMSQTYAVNDQAVCDACSKERPGLISLTSENRIEPAVRIMMDFGQITTPLNFMLVTQDPTKINCVLKVYELFIENGFDINKTVIDFNYSVLDVLSMARWPFFEELENILKMIVHHRKDGSPENTNLLLKAKLVFYKMLLELAKEKEKQFTPVPSVTNAPTTPSSTVSNIDSTTNNSTTTNNSVNNDKAETKAEAEAEAEEYIWVDEEVVNSTAPAITHGYNSQQQSQQPLLSQIAGAPTTSSTSTTDLERSQGSKIAK